MENINLPYLSMLKYPRNIFERRITCGICGEQMKRTNLRRHSPERALICPTCFENRDSPGYNYRYPFYDLIWETYRILLKEKKAAIRTGEKITEAQENGKIALINQFYQTKMSPIIQKIQTNSQEINQLFLDTPIDEPFSIETAKAYLALQNQATILTEKLAVHANTLLEFYNSISLDNPWYLLFSSIPDDFELTPELSRKTIASIEIIPDERPRIILTKQEERARLQDSLKFITRAEQKIVRKENNQCDQ